MSKPERYQDRINIHTRASFESGSVFLKSEQVLVPRLIEARSEEPASCPFDVTFSVELDTDGTPACTVLQVRQREGGPAVTKTALSTVPIALLVKAAVQQASVPASVPGSAEIHVDLFDEGLAVDVYAALRRGRPATPRRTAVTDDHLREVAEVYRMALANGDPPKQTVADVLALSVPTAGRHISMARERQFLGKTTPGRKGENR